MKANICSPNLQVSPVIFLVVSLDVLMLWLCLVSIPSIAIFKGDIATNQSKWCFMAAFLDKQDNILCSGVIVSSKLILTVASCVEYCLPMNVRQNANNKPRSSPDLSSNCHSSRQTHLPKIDAHNLPIIRSTTPSSSTPFANASDCSSMRIYTGHLSITSLNPKYVFRAEKVILHGKFNHSSLAYNLALVKVDRKIKFNGAHRLACPACLVLTPDKVRFDPQQCYTSGWGQLDTCRHRVNHLREVRFPMLPDQKCKKSVPQYQKRSDICAGFSETNSANMCEQDMGGPLACPLLNTTDGYDAFGVWGVASLLSGCKSDKQKFPVLFTRASAYKRWFDKHQND